MKRLYKERRIYFFRCTKCQKENCKSYKRKRAKGELCRKCRKNWVDPNQVPLFSENLGPAFV